MHTLAAVFFAEICDMITVRPPQAWPEEGRKVFLAGSIEMDQAADWQDQFAQMLADTDLVLLNPRRLDWDDAVRQEADEPDFHRQVTWELEGLEAADVIVMYFDPETKSPVSLLELGLHARSGRLLVCCPDGFWRRGNVVITCERYGIPMYPSLSAMSAAVRTRLPS